jgi:hypothetical protein
MFFFLTGIISFGSQAETYATVLSAKNMEQYALGKEISTGSEIITEGNQKLAMKTTAGDIIVVDANSHLVIKNLSLLNQLFGKIYFLFAPRLNNKVEVQTVTALIGIRGTNFLLTTSNDGGADLISLENGKLNIDSPDSMPFKIYKEKEIDEFDQFKEKAKAGLKEINTEFKSFKKDLDREFVEYKLSMVLSAGKTLKIVGRDVVTIDLTDEQQNEIDAFKQFIKDAEQ